MNVRRSLVVNSTPLETRIALMENGQLCELFFERTTQTSQLGNIYKGRTTKVLPGMKSAFLDIGEMRDGFLYLNESEVKRPTNHNTTVYDYEECHTAELSMITNPLPLLKKGDEVLVQVVKDSIGSKGVRLSRRMSIPGRFLVFMPGVDYIGVSRKITDSQERERLRTLVKMYAKPGEGFIVRTTAMGENDDDLINDLVYLRTAWNKLQVKYQQANCPGLIWKDLNLLQRSIRNLFREELTSLWVDNSDAYDEAIKFIRKLHPEWVNRVKHFTSDLSIFEAFGIEKEIDCANQAKVNLKCGGSIVINQTEALVSIDVNTGKFVGKSDLEETVFTTNMEAIPEIIRQLRLRNLGGIIIIDFIDMADVAHRECVMKRLQEELALDRNYVRAITISDFGLVEMTRKRTGPSLERMLTSPCPHCAGSGRRLSAETAALRVCREIARLNKQISGNAIKLTIHSDLNNLLNEDARKSVNTLVKNLNARAIWKERSDGPVQEIGIKILPLS